MHFLQKNPGDNSLISNNIICYFLILLYSSNMRGEYTNTFVYNSIVNTLSYSAQTLRFF